MKKVNTEMFSADLAIKQSIHLLSGWSSPAISLCCSKVMTFPDKFYLFSTKKDGSYFEPFYNTPS